jgi:hypothetical protein
VRRALIAAVLLVGCVACRGEAAAPAPSGGDPSVEQELGSIESTLDKVESELAGD